MAPFTCCSQEGSDSPTWQKPSAHLLSWLESTFPASPHRHLRTQLRGPELPVSPHFHVRVCVREPLPVLRLKLKATTIFSLSSCPIFTARSVEAALLTQAAWCETWRKHLWRSKPSSFLELWTSDTPFQWYPIQIDTFPYCWSPLERAPVPGCVSTRFPKVPMWCMGRGQRLGCPHPNHIQNDKRRNQQSRVSTSSGSQPGRPWWLPQQDWG